MILTKLKLRNFGIHRSLDLNFSTGRTGIVAANGKGKSTLLRAIKFLLSGDLGKDVTKETMITNGETTGYAAGEFLLDDKPLTLERHLDATKVILKYDGVTYKKASEVKELWDKLLQITPDIVNNILIASQGEIPLLFNGDTSVREKIFQKIFLVPNTVKLRTLVWDEYVKKAPPELPVSDVVILKSDYQCIEKLVQLTQEELGQLLRPSQQDIETMIKRKSYVESCVNAQKKVIAINTEIEAKDKRIAEIQAASLIITEKLNKIPIESYRAALAQMESVKALYEQEAIRQQKINVLKAKIAQIPAGLYAEAERLHAELRKLEGGISKCKHVIQDCNTKLAGFAGLEGQAVCPTCKQSIQDIAKIIADLQTMKTQYLNVMSPLQTSHSETGTTLIKTQDQADERAHLEQQLETLETSGSALALTFDQSAYDLYKAVISQYDTQKGTLEGMESLLRGVENEKRDWQLALAALPVYDRLSPDPVKELAVLTANLSEKYAQIEAVNAKEKELALNQAELARLATAMTSNEAAIQRNQKRQAYLDKLMLVYEAFHTSQFPRKLIMNYADIVTEYMNANLIKFNFPYTAQVNDNFGIDILDEKGRKLPFVSGAQEVIAGLSLRMALHELFSQAFPIMIIDEGSAAMNEENANLYFEVIRNLKAEGYMRQIIIIDHHQQLKEVVDHIIEL